MPKPKRTYPGSKGVNSQEARQRQKKKFKRQAWWQKPGPIIGGSLISIVLIIALFIYIADSQTANNNIGKAVPASVMNAISQVNPSTFKSIGTNNVQNPLKPISGASVLKGPGGKSEVLYIGADYCPYCAAERWSIIIALSRFGSFQDLHLMQSSGSDAFPNTSTFTFYQSSYSSEYIDFVPVETQTRDLQTLQTPTSEQQQIQSIYDAPPYTDQNSANSIPFISIGNQYTTNGAGFNPSLLTNLSWQNIANRLNDSNNQATQGIIANANYITAAICQISNQQPANVCSSAPIPTIIQQIKG